MSTGCSCPAQGAEEPAEDPDRKSGEEETWEQLPRAAGCKQAAPNPSIDPILWVLSTPVQSPAARSSEQAAGRFPIVHAPQVTQPPNNSPFLSRLPMQPGFSSL